MEQEKNTLSVLQIAPGQHPKPIEIDNDLRPSVLAKLQELVQAVAAIPNKVRNKDQELGL